MVFRRPIASASVRQIASRHRSEKVTVADSRQDASNLPQAVGLVLQEQGEERIYKGPETIQELAEDQDVDWSRQSPDIG